MFFAVNGCCFSASMNFPGEKRTGIQCLIALNNYILDILFRILIILGYNGEIPELMEFVRSLGIWCKFMELLKLVISRYQKSVSGDEILVLHILYIYININTYIYIYVDVSHYQQHVFKCLIICIFIYLLPFVYLHSYK